MLPPPDWRIQEAKNLAAEEHPNFRGVDSVVRKAVLFFKAMAPREPEMEPDWALLGRKYPDTLKIYRMVKANDLLLYQIEGLVLAKQTTAEIAAYLCIPESFVKLYEDLYFDVRQHMKYRGYVLCELLRVSRNPSFGDLQTQYRSIGYTGGVEALRVLWGEPMTEKTRAFFTGMVASRMQKAALVAVYGREITPDNACEIINQYIRQKKYMLRLELMRGRQRPLGLPEDAIRAGLEAMLRQSDEEELVESAEVEDE